MSESSYNPNDPEFLLSKGLDETLSANEQRRLQDALRDSPELRRQADRLRAIHRIIRRFGAKKAEADWDRLAASIDESCLVGPDAAGEDEVETLVARWGKTEVDVDWDGFTAGVMDRITERRRSHHWGPLLFRLGAPLAAAAAIAFAVIGYLGQPAGVETVSVVTYEYARRTEVSRVSFSRGSVAPEPATRVSPGFGFVWVESPAASARAQEFPLP